MRYQSKNYLEPGGKVLHIGGKLAFDENGTIEGLPVATDANSGGVLADAQGVSDLVPVKIGADGKLYAPQLPAQADSEATTIAAAVTDLNALLAKLRAAGYLAAAE